MLDGFGNIFCCDKKNLPENKKTPTLTEVVPAIQLEYAIALERFETDNVRITKVTLNEADLTLNYFKSNYGNIFLLQRIWRK